MILTCELCQSQFLTESDPHVVIPGPETKIYCYCQIKSNEQKWIDQLKHEHKLYQKHLSGLKADNERLEVENERLQNYVITGYEEGIKELKAENAKLRDCVIFYADEDGQVWAACQDTDTKDTCCHMVGELSGGKSARQVLKELEKK